MGYVSMLGNEIRKVDIFKDNAIQLTVNLGELDDDTLKELYTIKKKGEFKIMIANVEDWPQALITESHIELGG